MGRAGHQMGACRPHAKGGRGSLVRLTVAAMITLLSALVGATEANSVAGNPRVRVAAQVDVPPGFTQTLLAGGLKNPTVFAFAPSGDVWIGQQGGAIVVFHNGTVQASPVVTLKVDGTVERGLLGLAFDPGFASNGFIYVSYVTSNDFTQVSRLTVVNGTASLASERILVRGNQSQGPNGPGNDLKVGPDGKLWWSVGDNPPAWSNAQTLTNVYGKIHRLNLDGTIPADNPFVNIPGAVPSIYAYGLRNPFRFTFLPSGSVMTTDTGSSYWEELNLVQPGGNYGWDFNEGNCFSCGSINPVYAYGHLPLDGAISAVAAYSGSTFPNQYDHVVFIGDYNRRDIEAVSFDPTYQTEISDSVFDTNAGTIADLQEGPDGNLYFVGIFEGKFWKISPSGPFAPTAAASAAPNAGTGPLNVQFSSAGSAEPYGRPVTYSWDFGDGTPADATASPSHLYLLNGTYTATLTVAHGAETATATTTVVVGRPPPSASIVSPAVNATYGGGDTVAFTGTATDSVDGTLPPSAYTWQVDFFSHGFAQPFTFHEVPGPFMGPVSGVTGGRFVVPTDPSNAPGTFYRVTLTVVDSGGISTVVTRDIRPELTSWTTNANVGGAAYVVDGTWHTASYTTQDVVGIRHVLTGVPDQTVASQRYRLAGWADGSALTDSFTSTASPVTHTAVYDAVQSGAPSPWRSADVGAPLLPGAADHSTATGTFYLDGAGADMFGKSDQFHYVSQALNGDGTIIARVRYQTESDPWTKAGVMIKQSTTSGSSYVAALVTPDVSPDTPNINGVNCVFPSTAPGAGCDAPLPPVVPPVGHGIRLEYNFNGSIAVAAPVAYASPNKWLKLQRAGNVFTSWYSNNGSTWTRIGATTLTMTGPVTIGLFVTSHNVRQPSSVAFDSIQLSGAVGHHGSGGLRQT